MKLQDITEEIVKRGYDYPFIIYTSKKKALKNKSIVKYIKRLEEEKK